MTTFATLPRRALCLVLAVLFMAVAGCTTTMAPTGGGGGLSPGLVAAMDRPGAQLNRAEALGLINAYRASRNVPALTADASLDIAAQALAERYASASNRPSLPVGVIAMPLSAGYANFAETFSGWRNSPGDARVLAMPSARRAGLGVAYNAGSAYGVHWVLLLDD